MTNCKECWWKGKPIECPADYDVDTKECKNFKPIAIKEKGCEEIKEVLLLLVKAIEQNTINTYQEQGCAAADVVFGILHEALEKIKNLDHPTEKGGVEG